MFDNIEHSRNTSEKRTQDVWSARSTSGFFLELVGRNGRFFPLSWGSERQGRNSNHTQDAEIVSLSACLKTELIPTQILLQVLLGKSVLATIYEDNAAYIIAVDKGYSPTLRYLRRTQRISISFLKEILRPGKEDDETDLTEEEGTITLEKIKTAKHKRRCLHERDAKRGFRRGDAYDRHAATSMKPARVPLSAAPTVG